MKCLFALELLLPFEGGLYAWNNTISVYVETHSFPLWKKIGVEIGVAGEIGRFYLSEHDISRIVTM